MNSDFQKELKGYFNAINKLIVCKRARKKVFIETFKASVDSFIDKNDSCNMDTIRKRFGTPELIAQGFLETLDPSYIKKALNWKKCILFGVLLALLIWAIIVVIGFIEGHKASGGYGIEETLIEPNLPQNYHIRPKKKRKQENF